MKKPIYFFFLILALYPFLARAQGIKGLVIDDTHATIPFATVYIEELKTGTTTNENGEYLVRAAPGKYHIQFRSIGYFPETREIIFSDKFQTVNITLKTQVLQLNEVTISRKSEDPAYAIMRKVISRAPYHQNLVKHYKSTVYIRGSIIFTKVPKLLKVEVNNKKLKSGDHFLQESYNEITFDAPDKYHQVVKSIKSNFPEMKAGKIEPVSLIQASFYMPEIIGMISPLAPNAFSFYKFVYKGFSKEGDKIISKIEVIPSKSKKNFFSGYIYIVEDLWCLHSVDLTNETMVGPVRVKQMYSPVSEDAWLPVSHNISMSGDAVGFKGEARYNASVKYTDIVLDTKLANQAKSKAKTVENTTASNNKNKAVIDNLIQKDKLTNHEMMKLAKAMEKENKKELEQSLEYKDNTSVTIENEATKRDTAYWNQIRAVPLDSIEVKTVNETDSLLMLSRNPLKDSLKRNEATKTISFKKIAFGNKWYLNDSVTSIYYEGLIRPWSVYFNTVDGWVFSQYFEYKREFKSSGFLELKPLVVYSFEREKVMFNLWGRLLYAPVKRGNVFFSFGSTSTDYILTDGVNRTLNTLSTLFFTRNYEKLFDYRYLTINPTLDLTNGLELKLWTEYAHTAPLNNNTDFRFIHFKNITYTSNVPDNPFFITTTEKSEQLFHLKGQLEYTPRQHFKIIDGVKHLADADFPTFYVAYNTGLKGVLNSTTSFQQISGGFKQNVYWGIFSALRYSFVAGKFVDAGNMHFSEFKHFTSQYSPITFNNFANSFVLLPYYKYSTNKYYIETHIFYQEPFLILKYLPLISELNMNEALYLNYLTTEKKKNYTELGYALTDIFFVAKAGVFVGFENSKYQSWGIRISIDIRP